jgi:ankyrin repeat protein
MKKKLFDKAIDTSLSKEDSDTEIDTVGSDDDNISPEKQIIIDTILQYIAQGKLEDAMNLIDEERVSFYSIGSMGSGFIHAAISYNHFNILERLLVLGVDPNNVDEHGQSPLNLAIACNEENSIERVIRENFANVAIHNIYNTGEMVELLLRSGADPNRPNEEGRVPIHLVAQSGGLYSLQFLSMNGVGIRANLRILDDQENNALYYAAIGNSPNSGAVAEFLIAHGGLDLNDVNIFGNTVLHEAARVGNIFIIRELLRYCPDIHIQNDNGETALDLGYKNEEVRATLIAYDTLEGEALQAFVYDEGISMFRVNIRQNNNSLEIDDTIEPSSGSLRGEVLGFDGDS